MYKANTQPYRGDGQYIFVSYSHMDADEVFPILDALSARGYRIWYDDGITSGSVWSEDVANHLLNSALVIAFFSPNYIASDNCIQEISYTLDKKKRYLEVDLQKTEKPTGLEMRLCVQKFLSRENYRDWNRFLDEICAAAGMDECRGNETSRKSGSGVRPPRPARKTNPVLIACAAVLLAAVIAIILLARGNAQMKAELARAAAETPVITEVPEITPIPVATAEPTAVPTADPEPTSTPVPEPTPLITPVPEPDGYLWDVSSVVTVYDSANHSTKYESGYSNPDGTYCSHAATQYYAVYNVTKGSDGYIYFTFTPDSTEVYHTLPINYYTYRPVDGPSH